jgi:Cu-Zn family superoxide dismutase
MTSRSGRLLAVSLSILAVTGVAAAQEPVSSGTTAANSGAIMARLSLADGTDVGTATFRSMRAGVHVEVDLSNLPVGPHGIHIHETGACTPDFAAAGGHLAPDGHEHGFAQAEDPHPGDLPNIQVGDDGAARAEFLNWRLNLDDLLDDDGSAVVVHSAADTYMDPTSAGDRIACGVVEQLS